MAIPILIGVFAGAWIDNKLNSQPIVLIIMILMGLAAGILGAYHQIAVILPRQKGKHAGKTNSDQNERDADRF
jgi:F0F1-type ATP synthase assembly protein I